MSAASGSAGANPRSPFPRTPTVAGGAIAFATTGAASAAHTAGILQALGWQPVPMQDAPGLAVARTLAMLVNEAADAVQQGVCTPDGADAAMKLGVNYPRGPLEWADRVGLPTICNVLSNLARFYGEDRYRVSPLIQQRVLAGKKIHD